MIHHTYLIIFMPSRSREDALSEVIGFILILALIAALASLYLTYVVPAQGREGEIKHMATINDQFLGYKTAIDSLWINDQKNVPISRTFTLGTLTGTTQGSFVIPIFQPYPSSGSIVVNGRGEMIVYEVDALVEGHGSISESSPLILAEPRHLYVNLSVVNLDNGGELLLEPSNGNWKVWLNVTKMISSSSSSGTIEELPELGPFGPGPKDEQIRSWINTYLVPWSGDVSSTMETENDLTITVIKNGNETLSNWVILRNIEDGEYYIIDILDDAYGFSGGDLSYPFSLSKTEYGIDCVFLRNIPQIVDTDPHSIGSLEYRSNNNYWIQQNYYYQNGAVFLEQPGEGSVVKTMPSITLTKGPSDTLIVRIIDIAMLSDSRSLGGTGSVEVTSFVSEIMNGQIEQGTELATGIPNAKDVVITVDTTDEQSARAWDGAFRQVKTIANTTNGIPTEWSEIISGTLSSEFRITGNPINTDYDILLDYTRVNMSVELQPVAI